MTTITLIRTSSGPVQSQLAHGSRALLGRSRGGGFLSSAGSLRLLGRETRGTGANSQRVQAEANLGGSDGGRVGSRSRRVGTGKAVEEQEELEVVERTAPGVRVLSGLDVAVPEEVVFAGGAGAGSGRRAGGGSGGGGRGGGKDRKEGTSAGGGQSEMGAYYQEMLEADPGNPLLLRNYGKFLHEVEGDVERAEECYGRAILSSPGDGEVLSLYGKLIWDAHRDEGRAESYFERAVEAAPDDCYVLGSYAHFLWDADEEEEKTSSPSATSQSSQQQQPQHLLKACQGTIL